jgi:hypothetical protein
MFFSQNALSIMFFPRMCCESCFSQNLLLIMFFPRMCCQPCFS